MDREGYWRAGVAQTGFRYLPFLRSVALLSNLAGHDNNRTFTRKAPVCGGDEFVKIGSGTTTKKKQIRSARGPRKGRRRMFQVRRSTGVCRRRESSWTGLEEFEHGRAKMRWNERGFGTPQSDANKKGKSALGLVGCSPDEALKIMPLGVACSLLSAQCQR